MSTFERLKSEKCDFIFELFQKNDIVKEDEFHILYGTEWNNEKG